MKKWFQVSLSCLTLAIGSLLVSSPISLLAQSSSNYGNQSFNQNSNQALKIAVVNFKKCVEQSKIGKQEQTTFEALKKQMESVLGEKEKSLNEMATKFNDADYLDSLSPEAETDLKRKFRQQNQELAQLQNQYMQSLQQTNFKVIQKLNEMVTKTATTLANNEKLDIVLNEESAFFYTSPLDYTDRIISILDRDFDSEQAKENAEKMSNSSSNTMNKSTNSSSMNSSSMNSSMNNSTNN